VSNQRWVVVNIQKRDEFASQQLNRDTWNNERVRRLIPSSVWKESTRTHMAIYFEPTHCMTLTLSSSCCGSNRHYQTLHNTIAWSIGWTRRRCHTSASSILAPASSSIDGKASWGLRSCLTSVRAVTLLCAFERSRASLTSLCARVFVAAVREFSSCNSLQSSNLHIPAVAPETTRKAATTLIERADLNHVFMDDDNEAEEGDEDGSDSDFAFDEDGSDNDDNEHSDGSEDGDKADERANRSHRNRPNKNKRAAATTTEDTASRTSRKFYERSEEEQLALAMAESLREVEQSTAHTIEEPATSTTTTAPTMPTTAPAAAVATPLLHATEPIDASEPGEPCTIQVCSQASIVTTSGTRGPASLTRNLVWVQIRLPNGTALQYEFPSTTRLRQVHAYVRSNCAALAGDFDLGFPFPRKFYTAPELEQTLADAGT